MNLIGTQAVKFLGSFWEGRMTAEEKATEYLCTVLDFQIAHRMQPGAPPTQAFQLQEMGTDGTGSLERSDRKHKVLVRLSDAIPRVLLQNVSGRRG